MLPGVVFGAPTHLHISLSFGSLAKHFFEEREKLGSVRLFWACNGVKRTSCCTPSGDIPLPPAGKKCFLGRPTPCHNLDKKLKLF